MRLSAMGLCSKAFTACSVAVNLHKHSWAEVCLCWKLACKHRGWNLTRDHNHNLVDSNFESSSMELLHSEYADVGCVQGRS